jgi:hypothetical protein
MGTVGHWPKREGKTDDFNYDLGGTTCQWRTEMVQGNCMNFSDGILTQM